MGPKGRRARRLFTRLTGGALLAIGMWGTTAAAEVRNYLKVPGPVTFSGETFDLVWSSQPSATYTKQEYLPAGQTVDQYDRMILIEFIQGELAVADAVGAQLQAIDGRKGTDPVVNRSVITNEKTGEMLLDFLISSKDEKGEFMIEWNAYRYARASADGKPGIALYAISHRAYGNENARAFLETLKELRPRQIEALAQAEMPIAAQ